MSTLTDKQRVFIEAYLQCWNATQAARRAGYSKKTAAVIGAENLTKPEIRQAIEARLEAIALETHEVLARLTSMARGSMADFLTITRVDDRPVVTIDLVEAQERGMLHLIKRFKDGENGIELELYDAMRALELLGKYHKLFVTRQELSGPHGAPIAVSDAREQLLERLRRRAADADETDE